jgi:hypothetical protein
MHTVKDAMHENIPRSVITVWLPAILAAMLCLFLWGQSLAVWACTIPLWILIVFMVTLAEARQEGHTLVFRRWSHSSRVDDREVWRVGQSRLAGTGFIELRRFVLPWGKVYFQAGWANEDLVRRMEPKQRRSPHSAEGVIW